MKARQFSKARALLLLPLLAAFCSQPAEAQKLAVLFPEKTEQSENFSEKLAASLALEFKVLNRSLSEAAFLSTQTAKPFNLTTGEAKLIGAAIGCDFFLLVKAENQRRYSFAKKDYFESYAVIYLASSRTGRLVFWRLASFDDPQSEKAEKKLSDAAINLAFEISNKISIAAKQEAEEKPPPKIAEIPDENSPDAKNFRVPLPYLRRPPAYTALAKLYGIEATVDIEVDFDEGGAILRTEIVRWAGFGLDESVTQTIRQMDWRPASRGQKALPVRALLRYNFRKLEREE